MCKDCTEYSSPDQWEGQNNGSSKEGGCQWKSLQGKYTVGLHHYTRGDETGICVLFGRELIVNLCLFDQLQEQVFICNEVTHSPLPSKLTQKYTEHGKYQGSDKTRWELNQKEYLHTSYNNKQIRQSIIDLIIHSIANTLYAPSYNETLMLASEDLL